MALAEYTVSDLAGNVTLIGTHGYRYVRTIGSGDDVEITDKDDDGKYLISGTIDPYTFWVRKGEGEALPINIVMPLGGFESGLFRFPKIGEKVLVDNTGDKYYMMGYVPSGSNSFYPDNAAANIDDRDPETPGYNSAADGPGFEAKQKNPGNMDDFLQDYGQTFRYQKIGNNFVFEQEKSNKPDLVKGKTTEEISDSEKALPFSEIGFYNKVSKWPVADKVGADDQTKYNPNIDTINIQSAGDIEDRAYNYHLLKAKRFEILADTPEINPEARINNAKEAEPTGDRIPLGDHFLDVPDLGSGEIHIRAKKKVIIKAAKEITLQVGRTTVKINDKGFTVTSRKVNSSFATTYDTTLGLDSRDGISMTGQNVNVNSIYSFKLSDAWGGAMSSVAGAASIKGRQVNTQSIAGPAAITATVVSNLEVAQNITQGARAKQEKNKKNAIKQAVWISQMFDWTKKLTNYVSTIYGIVKTTQNLKKTKEEFNEWNALSTEQQRDQAGRNVDLQPNSETIRALEGLIADPAVSQDEKDAAQASLNDIKTNIDREHPAGGDLHTHATFDTAATAASAAAALIGADPLEVCFTMLDFLLGVTAVVYNAVEIDYTQRQKLNEQALSDYRDNLNLCAMSIDNGIIAILMDAISIMSLTKKGGPTKIAARANGDIIIKAGASQNIYMAEAKKAAATPAIANEMVSAVVTYGALAAKIGVDIEKSVSAFKQLPKSLEDPKLSDL